MSCGPIPILELVHDLLRDRHLRRRFNENPLGVVTDYKLSAAETSDLFSMEIERVLKRIEILLTQEGFSFMKGEFPITHSDFPPEPDVTLMEYPSPKPAIARIRPRKVSLGTLEKDATGKVKPIEFSAFGQSFSPDATIELLPKAGSAQLAIDALPGALVSERSRKALAEFVASVPGLGRVFGFECRLAPDRDVVDLGVCVARPADLPIVSPVGPGTDAWERIGSFGRRWRSEPDLARWVPFLFLEYDADQGPVPSSFAALDSPFHPGRRPSPELRAALRTAELLGREGGALAEPLQRAHEELPRGDRLLHVGILLGHPGAATRVSVALDGAEAPAYLERNGSPVSADLARAALDRFGDRLASAQLDFDAAAGERPRIGFGLTPANEAGWEDLVAELAAKTHSSARKAMALPGWPGKKTDASGTVHRHRLSHLKLVCTAHASWEVKAYLKARVDPPIPA